MKQYTIGVIVGSLRKDSYNQKLAQAIIKLAPKDFTFKEIQISDLPLYNQDDDDNQPEPVKRLKSEIQAVDGLIFVTPEYNRSVPGVLKNAIDCASRPYGKSAWDRKPAGMLGISIGAVGTACAQQHLKNILSCLKMPLLNSPEVYLKMNESLFADDGSIADDSRDFLKNWMDSFVDFIKKS